MSYDRQIDQLCPHAVVEETLYLDASRRIIRPLRPISSASSVRFRLNRALEVPSHGVHTPAKVTGTRRGPFTITEGVNDRMVIRVNQGPLQTVIVPAGHNVAPARFLDTLSLSVPGIRFSLTANMVTLTSVEEGRGASFSLDSTSTLTTYLGFAVGREWRGQTVVPGWTLVNDPTTLLDRPVRMIVLDQPLRSVGDFVELDYVTVRQECRRCGGTGVENDWRYGSNGETGQVRDEALLIQEIQKLFYTARGSNPFHTWYGTTLLEMIGKRMGTGSFLQNLITADVYTSFYRWQSIKRQQEDKVGQILTDREYPFKILSVDLQQSTQDPTVIFVNITIQNRSFEPISLERGLKLPQPLDLLGATQQQGLIRQSLRGYVQSG